MSNHVQEAVERFWNKLPDLCTSQEIVRASDYDKLNYVAKSELEKLQDPIATYHNILRGTIKVPEWLKDCRSLEAERDSLLAKFEEEKAIVDRCWKALGIETYEQAKPFAIDEHIVKLFAENKQLREQLSDSRNVSDSLAAAIHGEESYQAAIEKFNADLANPDDAITDKNVFTNYDTLLTENKLLREVIQNYQWAKKLLSDHVTTPEELEIYRRNLAEAEKLLAKTVQ